MDELTIVLTTARRHNVDEATIIYTAKIDVKDGVFLKSKLECGCHGNGTCPAHAFLPQQTRDLLREYKRAILIIGNPDQDMKAFRIALLDIEHSLLINNFHKALVLTPGSYDMSEEKKSLKQADKCQRLPLEGCGIDIFATVKKFKKNMDNYTHFKKNPAAGIILLD